MVRGRDNSIKKTTNLLARWRTVYFNCIFLTANGKAYLIWKLREAWISESESEECVTAWVFRLRHRYEPEYRLIGDVCVNIKWIKVQPSREQGVYKFQCPVFLPNRFFVFEKRAKQAEPTRKLLCLFEFWVRSKFGFARIFCMCLVVSVCERSERSLLGNFWVCSNSGFFRSYGLFVYFGFGFFCFCGVSKASGAHSEILGNFFCYICNVRY